MNDTGDPLFVQEKPLTAAELPEGSYAIVELFGHQTLVGRYTEIELFGTKMLALESLFNGRLLGPSFHGGAAIYRLTPCTAEIAWLKQPRRDYELPPSIAATVPPELLPPTLPGYLAEDEDEDEC